MKPTIATTNHVSAADARPNRLLIGLAALWMAASIAIGGMMTADLRSDTTQAGPAGVTDTAARP